MAAGAWPGTGRSPGSHGHVGGDVSLRPQVPGGRAARVRPWARWLRAPPAPLRRHRVPATPRIFPAPFLCSPGPLNSPAMPCTPAASSLGSLCTFLSSSYSLSAPIHFSYLPRRSPHIPLHPPVFSLNPPLATAASARLYIPYTPVLHPFPTSCISALPPSCIPIPKPCICPAAERSPWSPPAPHSPHHKEPVPPLPAPTPQKGIFLSEGMSSQRTRRSNPTDAAPAFTALECAPRVCRGGSPGNGLHPTMDGVCQTGEQPLSLQ